MKQEQAPNDNAPQNRHPLIEYDEDGNVIQIKRNVGINPLGCKPHRCKPGTPTPVDASITGAHKQAVEAWRATAPVDDRDILPTRPFRSAGTQHASLKKFIPVLRWWRQSLNPSSEMGVVPTADNDNEPEFIWSVPDRNPKPTDAEKWLSLWDCEDQEFELITELQHPKFIGPPRARKRLRRSGNMWFNTNQDGEMRLKNPAIGATRNTYPVPLGAIWKWREYGRTVILSQDNARNREDEKAAHKADVARANELLSKIYQLPVRYITKGKTSPGKSYSAKESRALLDTAIANTLKMPPVTKCPPGLPTGTRNVADAFHCLQRHPKSKNTNTDEDAPQLAGVRTPIDIGRTVAEMKADNEDFAEFRRQHPNKTAIIDLICAAGTESMADLESVTGRSDPGTNSRRAAFALDAVTNFLKNYAA